MTPFLALVFVLAVILITAKLAGYLSNRLGQPSVLGELLVGVILGPSVINLAHLPFLSGAHVETTVSELGELGVLLLMFLAGLELRLSDLARNTRVSASAGVLGVLFPVSLGGVVGELSGMNLSESLFLGLTLGATSVSISAQTLMELGVLRSRVGLGLLGAAVFDDVLVILLLSTFLAIESGGGGGVAILLVLLRMIAFLALSVAFGIWVLPRLVNRFAKLPISQGSLTLALVLLLFYGLSAELLGNMAAITGTFVAGLMYGRTPQHEDIERGMSALAYSFFVPIFFTSIGLAINVRELDSNAILLTVLLILVAVIGKMVGAGVGARIADYNWRESMQLGAGMVSRGEVGLIVAQVGVNEGLLNANIFSAIVGMVLATTLITPPMLRALFPKKREPEIAPQNETEPTE
ncbi:MAG TPA: cation:proton antiporter [Anaerolineaceae bacterium]|nr:cation:proton antiporter [Anaerolineaceae bacterium]